MNEEPLLLLPPAVRQRVLAAVQKKVRTPYKLRLDFDLSPVSRYYQELLLKRHGGDFGKVLDHVVAGADGLPLFDVIMCGMGPDGHTCSLFPGHPEVHVDDRLVVGMHDSPKPPPDRITFTLPLLHAARRLMLLVAGEEKREAMGRVAAGPDPATPASMLALGALEVVVDAAAAP